MQNNLTKLWNIKARVLSRCSHQGIKTNSYILKAQKTGRQLVRSERNIRPVAKAMSSPTGSDTDLDSDTHASVVLCNDPVSVLTHPASILKAHNEGPWLSPTTGDPALNALLALKTGLQPQPGASTHHRTPPRTRRVQVSQIIYVIDPGGLETFEKEQFRAFHRSNSNSTFKNEIHPKKLIKQALVTTLP